MINALLYIILLALDLYMKAIFIWVIMSWLLAFGIINRHNNIVAMIDSFLFSITNPFVKRIRKFVPIMGGIDISPIILIFAVIFLQKLIINVASGIL